MGRGKIEIKRIENQSNRSVTYAKRKKGILKKAKEIAILCDAKVSIIICNSSGKLQECFCSSSLSFILEEYQRLSGQKLWDAKHENLNNEIERTKKENENMEIDLRHLKGQEIQSLNHRELIALEKTLENGLTSVRAAKADFVDQRRQNDKLLGAENKRLTYELYKMGMGVQGNVENGYQEKTRDYNSQTQLPYAFQVQPMQPNLQGIWM